MSTEKEIRKQIRELAGKAHDRELNLYLSELENHFAEWREGTISPIELSDSIHEFHNGANRAIYKTYTKLKRDQLVARAIGIGLLSEDEVPLEIKERLAGAIEFYREHYEIDDDDPLSKLRR
ncbi:MAG: hypothetical protein ACXAB5_07780 [Candidatus Thorarchaeota archaeon]|jgi:hypothetical protein